MYRPLAHLNLEPARYTCYRAAGPIAVDGKLDEASWQLAPKSTPFVDIVTGEPAAFTFERAAGQLAVDGNLYEASWHLAPKSRPFLDIVPGEPAWFDTRVA